MPMGDVPPAMRLTSRSVCSTGSTSRDGAGAAWVSYSAGRWLLAGRLFAFQGGQPQFELVDAVPEYLKLGLVG
jgi:hypothetical protein